MDNLMDLKQEELEKSIYDNLMWAIRELNKNKQDNAEIIFKMICTKDYTSKEKIEIIFGNIKYKGVNLGNMNNPYSLQILFDNIKHYDYLTFIEKEYTKGRVECHGFGEYWSEDKITIIYKRINES